MTNPNAPPTVRVSLICPFHDEAEIIAEAVPALLAQLETLEDPWELLLVNDGSTDGSEEQLSFLAGKYPQIRLLGYFTHRGRGCALRTGINAARGDIVVTTELDLSWGKSVVHDLVSALQSTPGAQIAIASPHLPGGNYRNVPLLRVWLSRLGNRVIRDCLPGAVTMNTGMTRAYRREVVQSLPLQQDGKVFHLEVVHRAVEQGLNIIEIPAVLEWQRHGKDGGRPRRRSPLQIPRQIVAHAVYLLHANPWRCLWRMGTVALLAGLVCLAVARWIFHAGL